MMKKIAFLTLLFLVQFGFAQKVSFKILKEKTELDGIGAIILYVDVINKSTKDIVILKPATDYPQKWRYYTSENECESDSPPPIWQVPSHSKINYNESDLLVIPAKSVVKIVINGRHNANGMACNSKNFSVKLFYDANELIAESSNNSIEEGVIKKLTPIKIESKKTKIKIQ